MKYEIISQTKNPALKREELVLKVHSESNPSKKGITELIKKDETLTVIKNIKGSFGSDSFDVDVIVYESKETMDRVETLSRKAKKKIADELKKAEEAKKAAEATKTA